MSSKRMRDPVGFDGSLALFADKVAVRRVVPGKISINLGFEAPLLSLRASTERDKLLAVLFDAGGIVPYACTAISSRSHW